MPSPFPGMDPYLESPAQWSDFHATFIHPWREAINDRLPKNYVTRINEFVLKIEVTNIVHLDPHTEGFIEIYRMPDHELVTVLELLSPTNKTGEGRGQYLAKREMLLEQRVNLVELDLIRADKRLQLERPLPPADYYAFISRGERRPECQVYRWTVRSTLPPLPVPLKSPDLDIQISMAEVFAIAYQRGGYERVVHYDETPPPPSFAAEDADWVQQTARKTIG